MLQRNSCRNAHVANAQAVLAEAYPRVHQACGAASKRHCQGKLNSLQACGPHVMACTCFRLSLAISAMKHGAASANLSALTAPNRS